MFIMNLILRPLLLSGLLTSVVFMAACSPKDSPQQNNSSEPKDASQEIMDQLKTKPIKSFPSTPDDAHDIALLEEYDQKFTENNNALEADLKKRAAEDTLTYEIDQQLKRDSIESALNMLKQLDLKTEQGRYIQGLIYQFWENQAKVYDENKLSKDGQSKNSADDVNGMGGMFTAKDQLDHWKQLTDKK